MNSNSEKDILTLGEIVQFHEQTFEEIIKKYNRNSEEIPIDALEILLLFRKITEHIDAIFVLMDHSLEKTAESICRNLLESLMFLKYIAKEKNFSKERAAAYHYKYLLNQKDLANVFFNKQNEDIIKQWIPDLDKKYLEQLKKGVDTAIKRKQFININIEWGIQQKKQKKKYIEWYSLYQGPRNLKELAELCDFQGEYLLLYRMFSYQVHSQNAFSQIESVGTLAGIKNIRIQESTSLIITFTRILAFYSSLIVSSFFELENEEDIKNWFNDLIN